MKILIVIIFILNATILFAKSGDEVRNGGGLAENYLSFALTNMQKTIDICLTQPECGKRNNGREILKLIKQSLPEEISNNILMFSSEAQKPGFFIIDGFVRLAVTGNNVGDPIYYNLDLLYKNGEVRMNYGQAIQSLIHELGHHNGIKNHDLLDLLGAEVRSAVDGTVSDVAFLPHLNNQGFFAIGTELKSFETSGSLIILFRDKMIDLTPKFSPLLKECDSNETSADPLKSNSIQFFNMHWNPSSLTTVTSEKVLSGNVVLYCQHKYLKQYRKMYEFNIGVKVFFGTAFGHIDNHFITPPKFLFNMKMNPLSLN